MRLAFWRADKAKAAVQRAMPAALAPAPAVAYRPAPAAVTDSGDLDMGIKTAVLPAPVWRVAE